MHRIHGSLFGQICIALVLGVVIGVAWPDFAIALKPLGNIDRVQAARILNRYTSTEELLAHPAEPATPVPMA